MTLVEVENEDTGQSEHTLKLDWRKALALDRLGAVKKIKHTKYGIEVELHDKMAALRMLGQRSGLFQQVAKHETWRTAAIRDIRAGTLSYQALVEAFGDEKIVRELFHDANVSPPDLEEHFLE